MPPNPTEKAKIPLQTKKGKEKERLMHCPLPICLFFKTKTSPVHHKLSTTWQASLAAWWEEKSEIQHAFTTSVDLVYFVGQTGIQKSNLNKTRLTVTVKKKTTHSRLSSILINFKS